MAPVSGTVTLNGEVVTGGFVIISPADGRTATGTIDSGGGFVMGTYDAADGVAVGSAAVILKPPRAGEGVSPDAVIPPIRYGAASTSKLTVDVPAEGLTDYKIELTASPAEVRESRRRAMEVE